MPITRLNKFKVHYNNEREYHSLKREIFAQNIYHPSPNIDIVNSSLLIVDAGAHIGLATLYFKWLYPYARIIAIEANPDNFELLEQNIFENDLDDVEAYDVALAGSEGQAQLHIDQDDEWLSNSSLIENSWTGEEKTKPITVQTQTLAYFIDQLPRNRNTKYVLKMDVEGGECEVLFAAKEKLKIFDELMIEFHPGQNRSLNELISFLESLDFKVKIEKKNKEIKDKYHNGLVIVRATK